MTDYDWDNRPHRPQSDLTVPEARLDWKVMIEWQEENEESFTAGYQSLASLHPDSHPRPRNIKKSL